MTDYKVFNDPIHNSIQMPPYCQMIIDTPEFQRLRFIKQLGCSCYVFPSAVHTRFEHSIGVSHFAGKLANILQRQEGANILPNEVICVEIAGLCHDLGHGPFLHAFEDIIPLDEKGKKWTHKKQSVFMFRYIIKKYEKLKKKLKTDYSILDPEIDFICELILGRPEKEDAELLRGNKFFLYQIVNNTVNKVDVNKWDYFARDTLYLGMKSAFDFNRIVPFVRVLEVERDGETRKELCFRDKVANDLNHMFLTRHRLHYAAYEHRVTKIISIMLKDAFRAAADHLEFVGQDGTKYNLLESVKDSMAFCQVNDTIVNEIMRSQSEEPGMVKAREIVDRIHNRQLYQCIGTYQHTSEEPVLKSTLDSGKIKQELVNNNDVLWQARNIEVDVSYFDYGDNDKNPLLNIAFYDKSNGKGKFLSKEQLPVNQPRSLQDTRVSIYYTKLPILNETDLKEAKSEGNDKMKRLFSKMARDPTRQRKRTISAPPISYSGELSKKKKKTNEKDEGETSQGLMKSYSEGDKALLISLQGRPPVAPSLPVGTISPLKVSSSGSDEMHGSKSTPESPSRKSAEVEDDSSLKGSLFIDLTAQSANFGTYGKITVEKIKETPADLPIKEDEVVISYGLHLTSTHPKSRPVKIRMPHCAKFSKPEKAKIILYTRDHDSDKFKAVVSSDDRTPTCVVREKDLDLYLNHFSSWWIVAVIKYYFLGKRFTCTPYVPTTLHRNVPNCIYLCLIEEGEKEVDLEGFKAVIPKGQFIVEWNKGDVTIQCLENETVVCTKTLSEKHLMRCNREYISFILEARETRVSRVVITLILKQRLEKEIQFTIDFEEESTTRQSSQDPSTSFQREDLSTGSRQGRLGEVSEDTLLELVEDLGDHNNLPILASKLGVSHNKFLSYKASNRRQDCSDGTRLMLMDWKNRTPMNEQIPKLKKALTEAGYVAFAEKYLL